MEPETTKTTVEYLNIVLPWAQFLLMFFGFIGLGIYQHYRIKDLKKSYESLEQNFDKLGTITDKMDKLYNSVLGTIHEFEYLTKETVAREKDLEKLEMETDHKKKVTTLEESIKNLEKEAQKRQEGVQRISGELSKLKQETDVNKIQDWSLNKKFQQINLLMTRLQLFLLIKTAFYNVAGMLIIYAYYRGIKGDDEGLSVGDLVDRLDEIEINVSSKEEEIAFYLDKIRNDPFEDFEIPEEITKPIDKNAFENFRVILNKQMHRCETVVDNSQDLTRKMNNELNF